MSTDSGTRQVMDGFVADAKRLVDQARASQAQQLDLLGTPDPELMAEAREALGPAAGRLSVLAEARARQRGRPRGSRNKRTDDFARYLLSFGQHPAITMMQIQNTPPEVLIEASQQEKVHSFTRTGKPNIVIERMTYDAAQALRVRCAEGLLPYMESRKPVGVEVALDGDMNLLIPGLNISEDDARALQAGQFALGDMVDGEFTEYDSDGSKGGNG